MKFSFVGLKLESIPLSSFFGTKECPHLYFSYLIPFGYFGVKVKEAPLISYKNHLQQIKYSSHKSHFFSIITYLNFYTS
jgi:hypothetical protein